MVHNLTDDDLNDDSGRERENISSEQQSSGKEVSEPLNLETGEVINIEKAKELILQSEADQLFFTETRFEDRRLEILDQAEGEIVPFPLAKSVVIQNDENNGTCATAQSVKVKTVEKKPANRYSPRLTRKSVPGRP